MNGASAKHTSGPRSPRPIASRPTGFAAYAVAATTAGNTRRGERAHEPVRAPDAQRQRADDHHGPGERLVPEQHGGQRRHQRERRRGRRTGADHRVAPRRRERRPQRARRRATTGSRRCRDTRWNTSERDPITINTATVTARIAGARRNCSLVLLHPGPRPIGRVGEPVAGVQPLHEQAAEARAAAHHQVADVAVVDLPHLLRRLARAPDVGRCRRGAGTSPRRRRPRAATPRVSTSPSASTNVRHEAARQHPPQRDRGVRLAQQPHTRTRRGARFGRRLPTRAPFVDRGREPVPHRGSPEPRARARRRAGRASTGRCRRSRATCFDVEAAELPEEVGAHEHRRVRHEEHVAHAVVLFLVDLARLDRRERHAVVVDRHADLEQDLGMVVVDELGPDDPGVRPVRLLDHHAHRVGIEHDVVVAEEQEGRALDRLQRLVGRGREPDVLGEPAHVRGRQLARRSAPSDRRRRRCRARAPTAPGSPGRRATRARPRATARPPT